MQKAPSGTYEATSVVDGDARVYAYRSLTGLPLLVVVGIASRSWTAGLIDDLGAGAIGLATILAILFVNGRFALTSYRRLDASEVEHRLLNADLQAARERLAGSEKWVRMVADGLPALISYVDTQERYVFANAAYAQFRGFLAETLIGKTVRQVLGESAYQLVAGELALALGGQHVMFERDVSVGAPTRHWKFEYLPDVVDGAVRGAYKFATDITDAKRVETRLRRRHAWTH